MELVNAVRARRGGPLTIVDVGAAIGDTVLLLAERAEASHDRFICIEPDPEFHSYLGRNLAHLTDVEILPTMLSDSEDVVPAPVRTHSGTASPQGATTVPALALDTVLRGQRVDVIKIDTDGFDGKVLAGSVDTLSRWSPAVIFEWHPILLATCGQDPERPFEVLTAAGYETFVWFTKHGDLSHVEHPHDPARTDLLRQMCIDDDGPEPDWHFDVVAVPPGLAAIVRDLAP
ncbi:FkbM family methyltransferase [Phycicoccus duodecadis]|uniref:FkbM family methyltransferase n=1 Tax=Phycicoccus duodecadis TaxID=173053 RepID=UPI00130448A3|nr:FkbM family methyltransferase [Phycicoccus duodecadis]